MSIIKLIIKMNDIIIIRTPQNSFTDLDHLPNYFNQNFLDGLFVASCQMYNALDQSINSKNDDLKKIDISLYKYWTRSCFRCTPFGVFAGVGTIELVNGESKIILENEINHIKKIRLDMSCLNSIVNELMKDNSILTKLTYFSNNSIYLINDTYRYTFYNNINDYRDYELTQLKKSSLLDNIILLTKNGAKYDSILNYLLETEGISKHEAEIYLNELIQIQIIIPEIEPKITGIDPHLSIIKSLKKLDINSKILNSLEYLYSIFNTQIINIETYKQVIDVVNNILPNISNFRSIFQVDKFLKFKESVLNINLINSFRKELYDLKFLTKEYNNADLEYFITQFKLKYEDAEVPLALAIDSDLGIGYGGIYAESSGDSNFINGFDYINNDTHQTYKIGNVHKYVLEKYEAYIKGSQEYIRIQPDELNLFEKINYSNSIEYSQYVFGSLIFENNSYIFDLNGIGGPSSVNLFGRFAYGDSVIENYARNEIKIEESKLSDSVFAEIVHNPQSRIGNILLRPCLRDYEIPYIGQSGVDSEKQIFIEDILVSIVDNKIQLRSQKLNKKIIPRLSTAHNFESNNLPIYKFLCDLQKQGYSKIAFWDWGVLDNFIHLPQVRYNSIIIKKARWKFVKKHFGNFPMIYIDQKTFLLELKEKHKIPNYVVCIENQNQLFIDFNNDICLNILIKNIQKYKLLLFEELLFKQDNCIVKDIDGSCFTNEIIFSLNR